MMKPLSEMMRYWYELDSRKPNVTVGKETFSAWIDKAAQLETANAALLEALLIAKGSVEWMADATDADPEDHERLATVNEAIRNA